MSLESLYKLEVKKELIDGKKILITGGTGSFGRKLLMTLLNHFTPDMVYIYSRDEFKQSEMSKEFPVHKYPNIRYLLGDIRDYERLCEAFEGINIVFHAAALKQVPATEYNPMEAVKTNILGANNIVRAAIRCKVNKVVAISTDKCVNPINLYGATKLCFEKLFIHANLINESSKFIVARYGNVFGSRGSVVHVFNDQISKDSPFTVTNRDMTRFTMTLDEAVNFVLKCFEISSGGEIFVPKLPSYNILQLAEIMDNTKEIKEIGIRPGEKLHELMISRDESHNAYEYDDIYMILPSLEKQDKYFEHYKKLNKLPNRFKYTSGKNEMITNEKLKSLIKVYT